MQVARCGGAGLADCNISLVAEAAGSTLEVEILGQQFSIGRSVDWRDGEARKGGVRAANR